MARVRPAMCGESARDSGARGDVARRAGGTCRGDRRGAKVQQSGYQWGWGMKESCNNAASAWNLFVELGEDGGHFGHDFLGVLHAAGGGLERLRDLLLEFLLGLALEDHLLERAGELRSTPGC
jgi:hypothetical protein